MKRSRKKLTLSRETLQDLERHRLDGAAGGALTEGCPETGATKCALCPFVPFPRTGAAC
jgi:hypothetical protein